MTNFRCCLDDCDQLDLGFKGGRFTYSNRRKDTEEVKDRLDRAIANEAWRHLFPNAMIEHGFANCSDHVPVVISVKVTSSASRHQLKRFESMWLRYKCFKEVVRKSWEGQEESMVRLSQWNDSGFSNIKNKVKTLKEKIQELRTGPRTVESANHEATLSGELDEWMEREELFWRQRSRAESLKYGDRNTSYFHAKASQRRRRNHIDMLRNQRGEVCESEEGIVSMVTNYFTNIFHSQVNSQDGSWEGAFDHVPRMVSDEMNDRLKAAFTEGDVKRALFQMHPTKAPGLDGFSALFFQSNWHIVGMDVTREVLEVLNNGRLDVRLNETLIVLIPKVKVMERVEDLRPISLCNVVMKIITKALANRLKEILPDIIGQNQSASIGGTLITNNILIAYEVSHFIRGINKQKKGYSRLVKRILRRYETVAGQKVNLSKSEVVCSKNIVEEYREQVTGGMQMKLVDSHSAYLGLPITFSNRKTALFRSLEERIISKDRDRGIHWVRREVLQNEKGSGGLGFKRLELMNLTLLAKQEWRIMTKKELLVSKVFQAKYFPGLNMLEAQKGSRPSYAWRGEFTVKGAYLCAVEIDKLRNPARGEQSDGSDSRKYWKRFWKLKVPERIKNFGWRLFHDSLPIGVNLERRGCEVEN
ncbi:hypothetical protein QQ045_022540 [Rhodiola kirilowii]